MLEDFEILSLRIGNMTLRVLEHESRSRTIEFYPLVSKWRPLLRYKAFTVAVCMVYPSPCSRLCDNIRGRE